MTSLRQANMGNGVKKYSLHLILNNFPILPEQKHIADIGDRIFACRCISINRQQLTDIPGMLARKHAVIVKHVWTPSRNKICQTESFKYMYMYKICVWQSKSSHKVWQLSDMLANPENKFSVQFKS